MARFLILAVLLGVLVRGFWRATAPARRQNAAAREGRERRGTSADPFLRVP
jgi:hypothetical protein